MKKKIYPILLVIGVFLIFSLIWYASELYRTPRQEEFRVGDRGYLFTEKNINQPEVLPIEIQGKKLKYLFHNEDDQIRGILTIDGHHVFSGDEFYISFPDGKSTGSCEASEEGKTELSDFCFTNREGEYFVFGLTGLTELGYEKEERVLMIPAESEASALETLKKAEEESAFLREWLKEYPFSELLDH